MAETTLDDATRDRLRAELERHRAFLRDEIGAQGADADSDDVTFVDDAGFADRGRSSEERSNLRDVERALQKMETGAYGRCERCGSPIAVERLEALPWAVLCIDCKQRGEGR